ncbi:MULTISPECIES: acyl-CoA dehydrogenase family protein [Oceanobacillus]|uniref:Acyl-CoA dehydrogenase n=1 Tax=Oceanobacillus kimchii TaxID=746691 RepID=A0ABQ5TEK8_9BACI|nr:acyl-CoA dehydrogenase family protein [Oceanobacillus kimchii]MBT2601011.1 acyl-CoA dehydrogenase family protein [Oceanobacillus sp. ISL-74]MBT2653538.1 acyl-CoA dehydrogenase family protein [Oceanobacillus sp. ISL-73]GLO65273.1 acyl-CoA dehydrogenase [Oceanobacillus kimchii]
MKLTETRSLFPEEKGIEKVSYSITLSEDEQLISKTIHQLVDEKILPYMDQLEDHDYTLQKKRMKEVGQLGLMGAEVPEKYGGLEAGKRMSGIIAEKMGYAASFSVAFNIHSGVGTLPYVYFGNENQKNQYLPKLASGEWVGAYALTEPNAGSDALASKTTAKWNEEKQVWTLNGEKQWITNAHIANVYVVFANTEQGITAFIVERKFKGVSIGPEEKKLGIKGSSTATLILEDVELDSAQVLGEIGKGHYIALNILNLARLKIAFSNIGMSKQALELAIKYGNERQQFGRNIVEFGLIQEKIANMATAIYKSECTAYYTASLLDQHLIDNGKDNFITLLARYSMDCSINKVLASESLDMIVDEALQIHGGYGYMQEYEVERLYRDARINRLFEGTSEINRLTIAKSFLKQYNQDKLNKEIELEQNVYIRYGKLLLNKMLKAVTSGDDEVNQIYQGVIADSVMDVYVMITAEINSDHSEVTKQMAQIILEENLQRILERTKRIIVALVEDELVQQKYLDEIEELIIPNYINIYEAKENIAKSLIRKGGYYV